MLVDNRETAVDGCAMEYYATDIIIIYDDGHKQSN